MKKLVKSLPKTWNDDNRWKYNVIFLRHTIDSNRVLDGLYPKSDIEQVAYRRVSSIDYSSGWAR